LASFKHRHWNGSRPHAYATRTLRLPETHGFDLNQRSMAVSDDDAQRDDDTRVKGEKAHQQHRCCLLWL
jgi:hypothetical protein